MDKKLDKPDQRIAEQVAKKKRNRPDLAKFGEEKTEPGDNSRYLRYAMASLDLPPIDISDPAQVAQRINDYFTFCIENDRKPNKIGLANWLGVDATTVNSWEREEYRSLTHSPVIKKAVSILHELWADYMQNGKVNPASGIFLGKNMFGYKDVQDVTLTPGSPLGDQPDQKALEERIGALPEADE